MIQEPFLDAGGQSDLLDWASATVDLDATAREHGALTRARKVASGGRLLRLALALGPGALSTCEAARWAPGAGVARAPLSEEAVRKRFARCADWLWALVARLAPEPASEPAWRGRVVRIADATLIVPRTDTPGNPEGWRLHLALDLARRRVIMAELTDRRGAESLTRMPVRPGEVWVGDRGYGYAPGLCHVLDHGADFVTRIKWNGLALRDADGRPLAMPALLAELGGRPRGEFAVFFAEAAKGPGSHRLRPVRVIAVRKSAAEAAREVRRLRAMNRRAGRGQRVMPQTARAARYHLFATSVPAEEAPLEAVCALYRRRWEIETTIRRLKSIVGLGHPRARHPESVRAWIASHVLALLHLEHQAARFLDFPPSARGRRPEPGA